MEQITIKTKASSSNRLEIDYNHVLEKAKERGLEQVYLFLKDLARGSKKSSLAFWYGLDHLDACTKGYYKLDLEHVISAIKSGQIDVYTVLNSFITYLQNESKNGSDLSARTINGYVKIAKGYFEYCDIEISDIKFKRRVRLLPIYKEDEEAIDANDIREILNHCDNKRLKAYLLVLASGGLRATEALAIRESDIEWSTDKLKAAGIHVRKEFAKTKRARDIFISNEASRYLNEWLEWKYRLQGSGGRMTGKNDLVFARVKQQGHPTGLYNKMAIQFKRALEKAGYGSRKEDGVYKRRNITFHSFRRFAKTTIANRARNSDYSEWFLGHAKSTYYTNKPPVLREIYEQDCMRFLTFLDFMSTEQATKSIEARLNARIKELEKQLEEMKELGTGGVSALVDKLDRVIEDNKMLADRVKYLEEVKTTKKPLLSS